jgi:hypothetical protein
MMAVKEGKWRCPACGGVNLGRDMKCGSCGAVRGPNVKFFLDEDASEVLDEGLLATAAGGADWHCDFCGTDNRAAVTVCRQCGAPKDGMKNRETVIIGQAPVSGSGGVASRQATGPRRKPARIIIPAAMALVAIIAAVVFFSRGTEDKLRLQSGEWSRSIQVERQELVRHEDWRDQVPSGARILRTWEAQRSTEKIQVGTEKVKTGTKDMGNGFFQDVFEERPVYTEKPVFAMKVEYEIPEWKRYREAVSRGGIGDAPSWPDPGLTQGDREGVRAEKAVLRFVSTDPEKKGKVYTYESAKPEELASYSIGKDYPVMVLGDKVLRFASDKDE